MFTKKRTFYHIVYQQFVSSVFETLRQVADERANEVNQYKNKHLLGNSDDDQGNSNAIYNAYHSSVDSSGISKMTNFSPEMLQMLHKKVGNTVLNM